MRTRRAGALLSSILGALLVGVATVNATGETVQANNRAAELLGRTEFELTGLAFDDSITLSVNDDPEVVEVAR